MLETKLKHLAVLCLVLGFALVAPAAHLRWVGTEADANGVGYWDNPLNWDAGTLPTSADKAEVWNANSTVVVDDFDPNTAKGADNIVLAWGPPCENVTLWLNSYDGSGPGGVLNCRLIQMAANGGKNCKIQVDAGQLNVSARLRTCQTGANNSNATIIINGGTVNLNRLSLTEAAAEGQATLTVNGGQVNVAQDIMAGLPPAVAQINLNGGTLTVGELRATAALIIDVNEGTLILEGNQSDSISQLASSGQITIAGQSAQRGGLFITYDADAGTTTITADPSLANPNNAWNPVPGLGAVDVPAETSFLTWSVGDATAATQGHDVYFGIDPNAVANDSTDNTLGTYQGRVDANEMPAPVDLVLGQSYYWRVDQIADDASVYKGAVWSFTVADSLLVDDFEAYDNLEPNEIWATWKDKYDQNAAPNNGMQVGYWDPNYAETTIVKQASQSMPLFYDNNDVVLNSEAKRTFDNAQDWTKYGVKYLSLMFRGEPGNTFGSVYVKINDVKIAYPLLAAHLQFAQWKPWIIDLKDVATDLDLTQVTSLAIGVDGTGSGTLYIDNIRLYGQEAELMPATGVEPDNTALVAHYLLDDNAEDSSGNGHHGTVVDGTANWVEGVFDGALDFSNTTGVDCGDFDPTGGTGKFTLTLWCYWEGGLIQHLVTKSAGWGADTMMFQIEIKGNDAWVSLQDQNRLNLAYSGAAQAGFDVVPTHEWVHLAMVFDGAQATGYLNGIDSVGPKATGIGANVTAPVILGATETGDRIFRGLMDDVRIYNYPLTPAEIIGTIGVDLGFKPF